MNKTILMILSALLVAATVATACAGAGIFSTAEGGSESERYTYSLSYHESLPDSGTGSSSIHNTMSVTFDTDYFAQPATSYNHSLAKLAFGMIEAGCSTDLPEEDTVNWTQRYNKIEEMLTTGFRFDHFGAFNYNYPLTDDADKVAFTLADKMITVDGEDVLLITLVNRSGNYGAEWVSNFNVGTGGEHLGFALASQGETNILKEVYGDRIADPDLKVKILVTGYSRGAATANLTGHRINAWFRENGRSTDDVYVYTFATPNSVQGSENSLKAGNENIFNILSADDFVTAVPLTEWNFHHYGNDLYLPGYSDTQASTQMYNTLMNQVLTGGFSRYPIELQVWPMQSYANAYFSQFLFDTFGGLSYFHNHYQSSVTALTELIFDGSGKEAAKDHFITIGCYALFKAIYTLEGLNVPLSLVEWILGEASVPFVNDENSLETLVGALAGQFLTISNDKRDLLCEFLTGMDFGTLTEYLLGKLALWEMKNGTLASNQPLLAVLERFTYKKLADSFGSEEALESALATYFHAEFGTHIACTHRMEHCYAWLLAFDGEELFGDRVDVVPDDGDIITGDDDEGDYYIPSTAMEARSVPTFVKSGNNVQMLYNPASADMCMDLTIASYQIGKSTSAFLSKMQSYGYTQTHYIEDSAVYNYAQREYTETEYDADGKPFQVTKKAFLNFSAANAFVGIRRVKYNGKVKYAIAIAFRGSQDLADWVTDARFLPNLSNGFHSGFLSNINDLYADMTRNVYFKIDGQTVSFASIVADMQREDSRYCMVVTGHSLGAAMADLMVGYKLKNAGVYPGNVVAYTFAAPKTVPNSYSYAETNIFNIINSADLVPKVGADKHIGTDITYTPDAAFKERYGDSVLDAHSSQTTYRAIEQAISANPVNWIGRNTIMLGITSFTNDQNTFGSIGTIANAGTIINNGSLDINGDLTISARGSLTNNGRLYVKGNLTGSFQTSSISYPYDAYSNLYQSNVNAILLVKGDFSWRRLDYCNIIAGKVIFNGSELQTVKNLSCYDLEVTNPKGIQYLSSVDLYGEYKLNGNPLDCNGYYTRIYNGASFADNDNYGKLRVYDESVTLTVSVKCDTLYVSNSGTLSIPEGTTVTVDGNVSVSDSSSSLTNNGVLNVTGNVTASSTITNNGSLTVTGNVITNRSITNNGDLTVTGDLTGNNSYNLNQTNENAVLRIGGNFSWYNSSYCNIIAGKVIFNGSELQTVKNLSCYDLEVTNPAGIQYLSNIYLYGEYQLNGNPLDCNGHYTYLYNGASFADGSDYGRLYMAQSMSLTCNVKCSTITTNGYTLTIPADIAVTIDGSIAVPGGTLTNNGALTVTGDLTGTRPSSNYPHLNQTNENAVLRIGGNFSWYNSSDCGITAGKVIFNGSEQQTVTNLRCYDLEVTNPAGIKYLSNIYLYGEYKLNGNPLDCNDCYTYLYNGASFADGSNYGNLRTGQSMTLTSSVRCDALYVYNGYSLTIPADISVTVTGNVTVSGGITNNGSLTVNGSITVPSGTLTNNGALTVTGDLTGTRPSSNYPHLYQSSENAVLRIGGNFSWYSSNYCNITAGKVIFNGTEQQTVKNLKAPAIVLENASEDGTVFTGAISPSVLFDHKGNAFTLYNNGSGSKFVDYDGDGLLDNVDPEPTVGLPCVVSFVSADPETGTVSLDTVETIGGTEISFSAEPTFKYEFSYWVNRSGTIVSRKADAIIVAKGDDTITAVFTKRTQPISTETEGGRINTPASATIESEVTVSITENEGYIYTEGSLAYNGISIVDGKFIMPDEPVTLTAEFLRNESYFALKDAINAAAAISYRDYTAESFAFLTSAIQAARADLVNHVTAETSEAHIAALLAATEALQPKYVVSITVTGDTNVFYGVRDMFDRIALRVTYDNGTTLSTTMADCLTSEFDETSYEPQTVTLTYDGFTTETVITVSRRPLFEAIIDAVEPQLYVGTDEAFTPAISLYDRYSGELLTKGVDFTVTYADNVLPGTATATLTGIGNYEGTVMVTFTIYCEHVYEFVVIEPATTTEYGKAAYVCMICGAKQLQSVFVTENLPESAHNYSNNVSIEYEYTASSPYATRLILHFSSQTKLENSYDNIYIYDADGKQIGKYTGTALANKAITVEGNYAKIKLTSDGSNTYYGFSLDSVEEQIEYVPIEKLPILPGDLNGDGTLSIVDVSMLLIAIANDGETTAATDINGDGVTSIADVSALLNRIAGVGVSSQNTSAAILKEKQS